jgi:hypothetical protein
MDGSAIERVEPQAQAGLIGSAGPVTDRRSARSPAHRRSRYAGRVKRLFFIVMVGLWGAFIALAFASPDTLTHLWHWVGGLWWPFEIAFWIVFLPWMIGLLVWQADWSFAARMAVIVLLAVGWSAMSFPRK